MAKVKKKKTTKRKVSGAAKFVIEQKAKTQQEIGDFFPESEADAETVDKISALYHLDDTDKSIIQMINKFPLISAEHLGLILGCYKGNIQTRMKKPAFEKALKEVRATTAELYMKAAHEGAKKLIKLVESKDPNVALKAIKIATDGYNQLRSIEAEKNRPNIVIKTEINEDDGTLVQKIMEAEMLPPTTEGVDNADDAATS